VLDGRLQKRYLQLVAGQMNAAQQVAAGIKALPGPNRAFAATQGAWRFFANARVTLPKLVEPVRSLAREAVAESPSPYALVAHDWSKLDYAAHTSKTDITQLSHQTDWGYELRTALLIDAHDGATLAPMELELKAADGVHSTRYARVQKTVTHLSQLLPTMQASRAWKLPKTLVHVIDREADSLAHYREWQARGHLFLVRADFTRKVVFRETSHGLPDIAAKLRDEGAFRATREVTIRGQTGMQFVAEAAVKLNRPARTRTPAGRTKTTGQPLPLRLVIVHVRDEQGTLLAEWFLLTNVPVAVPSETIALWYYWRWRIESFHKLLKSGGHQVNRWQQETAPAIAKRLLVTAMACVVVWQLERSTTPAAEECKTVLVRLSGRQMKRDRPVTPTALLAGLHMLLAMLQLLEQYTPEQLKTLAHQALPFLNPGG
jgi:hypothetical protein